MGVRVTEDAIVSEVPHTSAGWWTKSGADHGLHYGERGTDGTVVAVCGTSFTPMKDGLGQPAKAIRFPTDPDHPCRECRRRHPVD